MRVFLILKLGDEVCRVRYLQRVGQLALIRVLAERHVVGDGSREHDRLLRDVAYLCIKRFEVVFLDVHAVNEHLALACVIKPRYEVHERRFAGAGGADERDRFAPVGLEAHVAYDAAAAAGIGEAYVFKLDRAAHVAGIGDRAAYDLRLGRKHLAYTLCGLQRARHDNNDHDDHDKAHYDLHRVGHENDHIRKDTDARGNGCRAVYGNGIYQHRAYPVDRHVKAVHDKAHERA